MNQAVVYSSAWLSLDECLHVFFIFQLSGCPFPCDNAPMYHVGYWDRNPARIRQVRVHLGEKFKIHLAPNYASLRSYATAHSLDALVLGLPSLPCEEGSAGLDCLPSIHDIASCPVFCLVQESSALPSQGRAGYHLLSSRELHLLPLKIMALSADVRSAPLPEGFVTGRSPAMARLVEKIRLYAASRFPVLILGETGTGKDLAARAVHALSSRRSKPYIALNCSALPENLVESELFGAERGAYTDAVRRAGAFGKASGGTLMLDEIGSMSLHVQPKLLRVLESGEYWRLGADASERSDFRLICATREDLGSRISQGLFRDDLFYRISDLSLIVPPLRDRMEDLGPFADTFCFSASNGQCELSPAAHRKLEGHHWPGNLRELKSVINRACVHVQKGSVKDDDIMFFTGSPNSFPPSPRT
jgi:hypothetical protein